MTSFAERRHAAAVEQGLELLRDAIAQKEAVRAAVRPDRGDELVSVIRVGDALVAELDTKHFGRVVAVVMEGAKWSREYLPSVPAALVYLAGRQRGMTHYDAMAAVPFALRLLRSDAE